MEKRSIVEFTSYYEMDEYLAKRIKARVKTIRTVREIYHESVRGCLDPKKLCVGRINYTTYKKYVGIVSDSFNALDEYFDSPYRYD